MAPRMKVDPEALRALRLRARMSIAELAKAARVADGTLDNIEAGKHSRNHMDTVRRLADFFDVEVTDLVIFVERPRADADREEVA